jgi:hypothetical protein
MLKANGTPPSVCGFIENIISDEMMNFFWVLCDESEEEVMKLLNCLLQDSSKR